MRLLRLLLRPVRYWQVRGEFDAALVIKPPRPLYAGHDERKSVEAVRRQQQAEQARRHANRIRTMEAAQ